MNYDINHTDSRIAPITVGQHDINRDLDITLFGRNKLWYGESMNENFLHLLENFACPADILDPLMPDQAYIKSKTDTNVKLLSNPTNGQFWYNTTGEVLHVWAQSVGQWLPLSMGGDIAVAGGDIADGETIPLPMSVSGYVFSRDECAWTVGYRRIEVAISDLTINTTDDGVVTAKYQDADTGLWVSTSAKFFIIGIRGNQNLGVNTKPVCVQPSPTPSTTPSQTPTPTPTTYPTESQAPSVTPKVLTARTEDYKLYPGTILNSIDMYARVGVDNGNKGINCQNGAGFVCPIDRTAPTTMNRANMRLIVEGGVAPYTVNVKYTGVTGNFDSGECFILGFGQTQHVKYGTSNGTILASFTIPTDGGYKNAGYCMGACNFYATSMNGTFSFEIEDDVGTVLVLPRRWSYIRQKDNVPLPTQSTTPTREPTPEVSQTSTPGASPTSTPASTPTPTPSTSVQPFSAKGFPLGYLLACGSTSAAAGCYVDNNGVRWVSCKPTSRTISLKPSDYNISGGDGNYTITATLIQNGFTHVGLAFQNSTTMVLYGQCERVDVSNNDAVVRFQISDGLGNVITHDATITYNAGIQ